MKEMSGFTLSDISYHVFSCLEGNGLDRVYTGSICQKVVFYLESNVQASRGIHISYIS